MFPWKSLKVKTQSETQSKCLRRKQEERREEKFVAWTEKEILLIIYLSLSTLLLKNYEMRCLIIRLILGWSEWKALFV